MNLGRYQILAEIGKGSMGVVYKALDPNLDLVVALKVLRRDLIADEEFVARFLAEARALAKLDHPNIVRVFNADRDNFDVYIAMEFIDGDSLSARMKVNPFPQDKIIEFGTTMADALDYAHKRGIVHRDIKPSNILYTSDGRLKITDFGIAHIEDPSAQVMTQAGVILGTPAYMSPEQVLSHPVDGRSDLFSLGIILYELSTGSRPFAVQGMNAIFNAITSIDPLAVCKKNTGIPRGFSDVIMKCLNKEPGQRYADCRVLAEALQATGNARVISTAHTVHHTGRHNRNFVVYSVAGILLFLTIAGLAVFFVSGYSTPKPQPKPVVQEQPSAPQPPPPAQSKQTVLNAESVPPGADVQIDGALQGITPMKMNILPGKHEVKISLRGYETWEAQVEMDKETETPLSVTLIRKGKR